MLAEQVPNGGPSERTVGYKDINNPTREHSKINENMPVLKQLRHDADANK